METSSAANAASLSNHPGSPVVDVADTRPGSPVAAGDMNHRGSVDNGESVSNGHHTNEHGNGINNNNIGKQALIKEDDANGAGDGNDVDEDDDEVKHQLSIDAEAQWDDAGKNKLQAVFRYIL